MCVWEGGEGGKVRGGECVCVGGEGREGRCVCGRRVCVCGRGGEGGKVSMKMGECNEREGKIGKCEGRITRQLECSVNYFDPVIFQN